jgi:hypothetical protein
MAAAPGIQMNIRRFLVITFCAFIAAFSLTYAVRKFSVFGSLTGHTVPATPQLSAFVRSLRPNYPYSVIRGGAYSPSELDYANKTDAIVSEHYTGFDLRAAHAVQLTDDRFQYASYRIKDHIYWTRKKLRIRKGEYLLTDGLSFSRARCGNRLSDKPHLPVSDLEQTAALSLPPVEYNMLRNIELAQAPPIGELAEGSPRLAPVMPSSPVTVPLEGPLQTLVPVPFVPVPSAPPPVNFVPTVLPPSGIPPILPVPEPGSVYLLVLTFCLSMWALMFAGRDGSARRRPDRESVDRSPTE